MVPSLGWYESHRRAMQDEALWPMFDPDGSATIDRDEFSVGGGLLDMLQANLPVH